MNPIVLIATHRRLPITTQNIESLLAQSIVPKIIVVVTDGVEKEYFRNRYPLTVTTLSCQNDPLGMKWQTGVSYAMGMKPNPLILTGSDDILGAGFIEKDCELVDQGAHFIGLQRWWIHNEGRAYLCDYLPHQPLGGGRAYSLEMLKMLEWKLFDISARKHLDDFVWPKVRLSNLKVKWVRNVEAENLLIHAIKGDWKTMNPFNIRHSNIKVLRSDTSERILPELFSRQQQVAP